MTAPAAFFADAMLGKLARWLRILGYDTAYERYVPDDVLIERALREGRWLLTRDRYLAMRKAVRNRLTLLKGDRVTDQLQQLARERGLQLNLNIETPCRCADCNLILVSIPPDIAAQRVPQFVATHHKTFAQCPGCRQIYWPGTHWARIRSQLELLKA